MAKRQRIAFDIDDVLADTTEALRIYVNQEMDLNLRLEDYRVPATYWGYYEHVWTQAGIPQHESARLISAFHKQMGVDQENILPVAGSQEVLHSVDKEVIEPVAVTSRELFMEEATRAWVERHFKGVFSEILLLGHVDTARHTKGDACRILGATQLVDDNIDHCRTALAAGVKPVLFGDYGWQHDYHEDMMRCKTWSELGELLKDASRARIS